MRRALPRLGLALAFTLFAPDPALSAEGAVEINQARAEAGGVTPADLPGFPVTLATPGSYVLTGELAAPGDATAIEVLADDVSLDLGGFSVRGGRPCTGAPPSLVCPGGAGHGVIGATVSTRVANGVVTGFANGGIQLGESASVSGVVARRNGVVGIAVGERSRIARCQATRNGGPGFSTGDLALVNESSSAGNTNEGAVFGGTFQVHDSLLVDGPGTTPACFADAHEPNNSEASAAVLGDVSGDDTNGSSLDGELAGSSDVDWFSLHISDVVGSTQDPAASLVVGGALRICVFYLCDAGTTDLTCPLDASAATSPAGRIGCCRTGGSVQIEPACGLAASDSGLALFRVDTGPADVCTPYQLDWHP